MTTFEFISVFISMIFGLALAHVLSGAMRSFFRREFAFERAAYLLFLIMLIIAQWWTLFRWRDAAVWTVDSFSVLVVWALNIFAMAVALYPPDADTVPDVTHRRTFLSLLVSMSVLDTLQTALLGDLFRPWYYLPFVGHYAALALLAIFLPKGALRNIVAAYFAVSMIAWLFFVRRLLE